jgi:hypothetical protein
MTLLDLPRSSSEDDPTRRRAGMAFPIHPHMLRHACGYALANKGIDTRRLEQNTTGLNHKTARYSAMSPEPFRDIDLVVVEAASEATQVRSPQHALRITSQLTNW